MKNPKIILITLSIIFIFAGLDKAQIKIGIGGGLTSIQSPGNFKADISSGGLGFTGNYHYTVMAKLSLPLVPFTPAAFIDYHILRGSGTFASQSIKTSMDIFSLGLEGEFNVLPLPFLSPYICADAALNKFGKLERTGMAGTSGISRYGVGIGVGAVLSILPAIDIDGSVKYQLMNLIGKSSGEGSINAITLNIIVLF